VQHNNTPVNTTTAAQVKSTSSDWKTVNNWSARKNEKFTTLSSKVADSSLSLEVAKHGLVLAFAKINNTIKSLPFQERNATDAYWYYQVSKGAISFSIDQYEATQSMATGTFKYFVFSPGQLKDLEARGYSKIKLMLLPYEELQALFKIS
jgi:hypothetical protein